MPVDQDLAALQGATFADPTTGKVVKILDGDIVDVLLDQTPAQVSRLQLKMARVCDSPE